MAESPPNNPSIPKHKVRNTGKRMRKNVIFNGVCLAATLLALIILVVLLVSILTQGVGALSIGFLTSLNSSDPHKAGVWTSLIGTMVICLICALSAIPLGVGTAVLIEEFKPKNKWLLRIHGIIDTNIRNLAGVPSIVYGILGVTAFATMFGLFGDMNSGDYAIGMSWYDQYQAEDKSVYYAPREGSIQRDPEQPVASPDVTLYKTTTLKEEATNLEWVTREDIEPRVEAIESDMSNFERAFRNELEELRPTRRGPVQTNAEQAEKAVVASIIAGNWKIDSLKKFEAEFRNQLEVVKKAIAEKTGATPSDTEQTPATEDAGIDAAELVDEPGSDEGVIEGAIDQEQAAEMAQAAIEAGEWSNQDPERLKENLTKLIVSLSAGDKLDVKKAVSKAKGYAVLSEKQQLREKLTELVVGLDGKSGIDLILARKKAIAEAVDSEYAARMPDVMMRGKQPVRVNRKAWYHMALPFGRGVLAGGLTLMLVILPIVIVASQEALRAVPGSYRQGALALGSTKWQSVSKTALPAAIPGICTGTILAISRAIGEAAPILVLGGTGFITSPPRNLMDSFSAMPMTIFQWTKEPEAEFKTIAAAGIIVLLIVLLSFNALAIYIRHRSSRHQ